MLFSPTVVIYFWFDKFNYVSTFNLVPMSSTCFFSISAWQFWFPHTFFHLCFPHFSTIHFCSIGFHMFSQVFSSCFPDVVHFPPGFPAFFPGPIEPRSAPGACATSPADAPTAAAPGATRSVESAASKNGFASWV